MPYGRGGAGNILQAKEDSKKFSTVREPHHDRITKALFSSANNHQDIEANHPSTSTYSSTLSQSSQPLSEYVHTGRGGAGNWYQPAELSKEGTFTQQTDSTAIPTSSKPQISTPWHPEGQELPVARSGRGGAGNFVWKSEEQVKKEREGRELEEMRVRKDVEKDVEAALAMPGKARLGEAKVGSVSGRGW